MQQSIKFANINVPDTRVFYKKNYVYAWVPNNTLVNGHVMLCPIKGEQRYRDLTNPELFEIALAMRELSEIIKTALRPKQQEEGGHVAPVSSSSSQDVPITFVMQEFEQKGANSDSSLNHLRVHILPTISDGKAFVNEQAVRAELDQFMKDFTSHLKNQDEEEEKASRMAQLFKDTIASLGIESDQP